MCLPCWRLVSVPTRRQLEVEFKRWGRGAITDEQYGEALWTAIRSARETRRTSRQLQPAITRDDGRGHRPGAGAVPGRQEWRRTC